MKNKGAGDVLEAIRTVLQGQVYVSKGISEILISQTLRGRRPGKNTQFSKLTDREFEIFQLIGEGLSTPDIGEKLRISTKTVETHRTHIKEKLAMKSSAEVIKHAIRWAAANQLI